MANGRSLLTAFISDSTNEALERYAAAHGLDKGYLIEEALLHYLQELPPDMIFRADERHRSDEPDDGSFPL